MYKKIMKDSSSTKFKVPQNLPTLYLNHSGQTHNDNNNQ